MKKHTFDNIKSMIRQEAYANIDTFCIINNILLKKCCDYWYKKRI